MNRIASSASAFLVALSVGLIAACDKKEPAPAKPADAPSGAAQPAPAAPDKPKADAHDHAHDDHGHGEEASLGSVTIAGFTVKVTQQGKVEAGKDAAFAFDVSGADKPSAVRAWIGTQDGAGSTKAKADAEEHGFHAHVEAPKPLPAGSKLWIEIEDSKGVKTSGSVDLKQ
jgi:hypothetical protein